MWYPFKNAKNITVAEKSIINPIEKKNATASLFTDWFVNGAGTGENNYLTIKRALVFYDTAAPVATAIDWINDEFKTLQLTLTNNKTVVPTAPILDKLKQPNDDMVQEEFLEAYGAFYLICNEVYLLATGNVNQPPAEINVISPEYVTVYCGEDGLINKIALQQLGIGQEIFYRSEKGYRFYNKAQDREIWQVKGFSAINNDTYSLSAANSSSLTQSRGRSKLSSIHKEINQYLEVATHNLSILSNGMIPSGTIEIPDGAILSDDQFTRLRTQVINFYSGSENAGKALILDNGMKFTPLSLKTKDMDFKNLSEQVETKIFNRYKVPLPLVRADNMTLANMETAKLNLYDNCVVPLAGRLLRELTNFLAPRYNLKPNDLITAALDCIPALKTRHLTEMKLRKDTGIYKPNELRSIDGLEDVDNGDAVYQDYKLVPLGVPTRITTPSKNIQPDVVKNSIPDYTSRKNYIGLLLQQTKADGSPKFTLDEVEEMADKAEL